MRAFDYLLIKPIKQIVSPFSLDEWLIDRRSSDVITMMTILIVIIVDDLSGERIIFKRNCRFG